MILWDSEDRWQHWDEITVDLEGEQDTADLSGDLDPISSEDLMYQEPLGG